jgi:hypothetical protein
MTNKQLERIADRAAELVHLSALNSNLFIDILKKRNAEWRLKYVDHTVPVTNQMLAAILVDEFEYLVPGDD